MIRAMSEEPPAAGAGDAEPRAAGLQVVPMREDQEGAVAAMLAEAFLSDPIFVHVLPEPGARAAFLRRFMAALARRSRRLSLALVTAPEPVAVSLWKGPDLRALSPEQMAMTGLDRLGEWLGPEAAARFERIFEAVDGSLEQDVPEPCWYLGVVGVAPAWQGRGLGSRLMAPGLERADRAGLPVTLETSQPRNLPLYRRHGFEVLRELRAEVTGGPVVWTMKRPPRVRT